jgi:hypothetical protein
LGLSFVLKFSGRFFEQTVACAIFTKKGGFLIENGARMSKALVKKSFIFLKNQKAISTQNLLILG